RGRRISTRAQWRRGRQPPARSLRRRRFAAVRRAHVRVPREGATRAPRDPRAARGWVELRRGTLSRRSEPLERRSRHGVGAARTDAGLRGALRTSAGRAIPALGIGGALAERPRPEELHVRTARARLAPPQGIEERAELPLGF